jgi:hypothetical protein
VKVFGHRDAALETFDRDLIGPSDIDQAGR